jgi:long-subunit acyl-CoA synthetase (AMP-forming)
VSHCDETFSNILCKVKIECLRFYYNLNSEIETSVVRSMFQVKKINEFSLSIKYKYWVKKSFVIIC